MTLLSSVVAGIRRGIETLAFWAAVALPPLYIAPVVAPVDVDPLVVGGLIALHAAALLVGHNHGVGPTGEPRATLSAAGTPDAD